MRIVLLTKIIVGTRQYNINTNTYININISTNTNTNIDRVVATFSVTSKKLPAKSVHFLLPNPNANMIIILNRLTIMLYFNYTKEMYYNLLIILTNNYDNEFTTVVPLVAVVVFIYIKQIYIIINKQVKSIGNG